MRADVIVLAQPRVDDCLRVPGAREGLGSEHLAAPGSIEVLSVADLPRRARMDLDRLYSDTT